MRNVRGAGFTLIEMMMSLVILAIAIAIVAPGFSDLIKNNRMLSQVYGMRAALNGARSEALAQRSAVTLCRSDNGTSCSGDGWDKGYIAFVDADGNGELDDPNDPQVVVAAVIDAQNLEITYDRGDSTDPKDNIVRFDSQGYSRDFSGMFTLCDDRGSANARGVIVTPVGVVRAPDPNDPLTCS